MHVLIFSKLTVHQIFYTHFSSIIKGDPLLVDVRGLEYMNDDPSKVDVLYGHVTPKDGSNK